MKGYKLVCTSHGAAVAELEILSEQVETNVGRPGGLRVATYSCSKARVLSLELLSEYQRPLYDVKWGWSYFKPTFRYAVGQIVSSASPGIHYVRNRKDLTWVRREKTVLPRHKETHELPYGPLAAPLDEDEFWYEDLSPDEFRDCRRWAATHGRSVAKK